MPPALRVITDFQFGCPTFICYDASMKRLYESHEKEYQRMEAAGTPSWMERQYDWAVDP